MLCLNFRTDYLPRVGLVLALVGLVWGQFPAPIKRCRLDDEPCLVQQAQLFFRSFKNGLPQYQIPRLEPMDLGTIRIESGGQTSSLQFSLVLTNAKMHNLASSAVAKSVKGFQKDLQKPLKLILVFHMPELEVRANYDVNGKILILPIVSKGDLQIKLKQVQAKSRIMADPVKGPDGKTYLKITEYKTVTKVGGGTFNLSNLFNDNVELRNSTLKVLNDEWDALAVDIQPKLNEATDRAFRNALQHLWDEIPYEDFFEN